MVLGTMNPDDISETVALGAPPQDRIELLGRDLMRQEFRVADIDRLQHSLAMQIGWHYLLDIIWILDRLDAAGARPGWTILDAGGGLGLLQYVLADRGYNVLSVDITSRSLPLLPRLQFRMRVADNTTNFESSYTKHISEIRRIHRRHSLRVVRRIFEAVPHVVLALVRSASQWHRRGEVTFLRSDLTHLTSVESASVDAVVSLSVVEHIPREATGQAISEMFRVVKPGGPVCVTTSAASGEDWYHEPSKGWCFSERSLRSLFKVSETVPGWGHYDGILNALAQDKQLPARLPDFYRLTANCGMPWGVWNPTYVPVGISVLGGRR